jgi:RNA polymerase sigma-70 factor (ECF subfamily)
MSADAFDLPRLRAMDEAAWAALQDAWHRRLFGYVKRCVGDHQTAEDLVQEVFLGAVRGIDGYDPAFTPEQFLFGIAHNRVVDHLRRLRTAKVVAAFGGGNDDDAGAGSRAWLELAVPDDAPAPAAAVVAGEDEARRRRVLGEILRTFVGELWEAGEFDKLMTLEFLFVLGGRNKDAAERFGYADEKHVAGVKFRALERLRELARQRDPNHSLFRGLWQPGAR